MATRGVRITVTGTQEVAHRMAYLGRRSENLQGVFGQIANEIAADERGLAPKVTGRLAASVRPSSSLHGGGVTTRTPYAGVVNFGWRKRNIAPALFAQRAADSKGPRAADELGDEIQRLINQAGLG